jgi:hypothetical protein
MEFSLYRLFCHLLSVQQCNFGAVLKCMYKKQDQIMCICFYVFCSTGIFLKYQPLMVSEVLQRRSVVRRSIKDSVDTLLLY